MKKVIYKLHFHGGGIINNIFLIELCCGYCIYLNLHNGHKVISINDEENIKKHNININNSTKQFDENK